MEISEIGKHFVIRKNTPSENKYIDMLIKEGERKYGKSDAHGHLVQDYVHNRLVAEGKRFKVPLIPGELVGYKPKNV